MFSLDAQLMMTSMIIRRTLRYVFQIVEMYTYVSVLRQLYMIRVLTISVDINAPEQPKKILFEFRHLRVQFTDRSVFPSV